MIIAELIKWNGEKVQQEIKREWIQDIVDAVVGQYTFVDRNSGFGVNGSQFAHINVYQVKEN